MRIGWAGILVLLAPTWAAAETRIYTVDPSASAVTIQVGRAGLFKFAGHEHEVRAPIARGEVRADPDDLPGSSIALEFESAALAVTGRGEPAADVPKVQQAMAGPKVLDTGRFPAILFRSRQIGGRRVADTAYELEVIGDLELRGVTRSLKVPVRVELAGETLLATGRLVLRQRDFGIEPISVAGVVKVKNELEIDVRILARLGP
jgi:polyisoprenoid-binding protein YceI